MRAFGRIDVRSIFNTLDKYAYSDYFTEFNHPRRELALLSTKNVNLSLPNVRENLKDIKKTLLGEWTKFFPCKESIDAMDYITLLKEYVSAIDVLDVYRIATEGKNLTELTSSFESFIDLYDNFNKKIDRIDRCLIVKNTDSAVNIGGVSCDSQKINLRPSVIAIAENDFNELLTDRKRMIVLVKDVISMYPDIVHFGLQNLWIALAKDVVKHYEGAVRDDDGLIKLLSEKNINDLNNDLRLYYAQNSVKRMLGGVPIKFKQLLNINSTKDLDKYRDDTSGTLAIMGDILRLDKGIIEHIIKIGKKTTSVPLSRIDIKLFDNIKQAKDAFLPVYELMLLLNKYSIDVKDFGDTKIQVRDFNNNITALHDAVNHPLNKKLYINSKLDLFIEKVNNSIDIATNEYKRQGLLNDWKKIQSESYRQNSQYLNGITGLSEYMQYVNNAYEYLVHRGSKLSALINTIFTPNDNMIIDSNLASIEKAINKANLSDIFSDFFFEMREGQTIDDWLNSVTVIETYNNDAEIVDFVEHNRSIESIRIAMGTENEEYLNDILSNDITFSAFAARIVSVLVNESFGRARIADKKRVTTKEVIDAYESYIKNQKAITYCNNLHSIYSYTLNETKELSKQSTLQSSGRSTMDKFRHNTHIIAGAFPIICATPKEVSKYIAASKGLFDYVIFDEASQLLPGQSIPSIYRAKKAVIIGDPHQMPPSLNASFGVVEQSEDDFDDLGESILDLTLKQPQKQHHLKVHYRSKYNKLFEPSREIIYSSDGIEPIFEAELAKGAPIDIIDDLGDEKDEFGYDKNFYKICESLNEYLMEDGKADFCVLFTRADVLSSFKDFLAETGERQFRKVSELYNSDKILLSTVTNCQGIEGVYTIIYMHHYTSPGAMWFFKESAGAYKRLNVSITRQRKGLKLLLADQRSHWVKVCDEKINRDNVGPNVLMSAKLMKKLLTSAGEQADAIYLDRKLGQNTNWFDSPLTEQLYNKLTDYYSEIMGSDIKIYSEVGWNLLIPNGNGIDSNERNVGFRIDLGIYSVLQKKFILGIEMDGAMYHSGFDKEHSDYNRQKVLEDKGWEIYRIWSTNWLNDVEREFNKLTQMIDDKLSMS